MCLSDICCLYLFVLCVQHMQTDRRTCKSIYEILYLVWCVYSCLIHTYRQLSHNNFREVPSTFLYGAKLTTL